MKRKFTASIWREGSWYVSQCLEVDVASQGRTEEEARTNLREAFGTPFRGARGDTRAKVGRPRSRRCRDLARYYSARLSGNWKQPATSKFVAAAVTSSSERTDEGVVTTVVPFRREVPVGTLRSILRQSGLSVTKFERL